MRTTKEARALVESLGKSYPYKGNPKATTFRVLRDGIILHEGTEGDCWRYLHRQTDSSVMHALRHEGYDMVGVSA